MDMDMDEGAGWGDGGVGVLPECLADRMAVELGEPVGRTGAAGVSGTLTSATGVGRELVAGTRTACARCQVWASARSSDRSFF